VTPETIKNCWKHTNIQRDPIILRVPQTLAQKGWGVIYKFADPSSRMTLPEAEDSLKKIFRDRYNNDDWRQALKIITETEPDGDAHSQIKTLQEASWTDVQSFIPAEYTRVAEEVSDAISTLQQRNRIFEGAPSADAYIEPDIEKEVEGVPIRTDDELVAEVLREKAVRKGGIIEVEDDECEYDEVPEMSTKEILLSIGQLQSAFLTRGDLCIRTAKMLALVQDEIARQAMQNAQQTTLDGWVEVGDSDTSDSES
jgi:hypothetical protein